jgi:hypothetical protein
MPKTYFDRTIGIEQDNKQILDDLTAIFADTRFPNTPDDFPDNTKDC